MHDLSAICRSGDNLASQAALPAAIRQVDAAGIDAIAENAGRLGYEIVDVSGFLDTLHSTSERQLEVLRGALKTSAQLSGSAENTRDAAAEVALAADGAQQLIQDSLGAVRASTERSTQVASWVASAADQITDVSKGLRKMQENNALIGQIAQQVNLLSINARIEASRAGDAGRGFAVIADTIKQLSAETNQVAGQIRDSITTLNRAIDALSKQSASVREDAHQVIEDGALTDKALGGIGDRIGALHALARKIDGLTDTANQATQEFTPAFHEMAASIEDTAAQIGGVSDRAHGLIDATEAIVQAIVSLGAQTGDMPFIEKVQADAARISDLLDKAVEAGRISMGGLFSREYSPIPNSRPAQVMAPFTRLTDELFPAVQEAALEFSDEVVFCAAVNIDGYLPTHNKKFSHPQGNDEAWNTGHCRNRRIFDDRVGLKAGRSTQDFLLQVYRRDMGKGVFTLMKDVSAPIVVKGRLWGGLRLAYAA